MSTPAARAHEDDAVLALVRAAPLVESDEHEAAAFAEGMADIKAGRVASAEDVRGRLKQPADE
jgi:predicted transcriptional regulator